MAGMRCAACQTENRPGVRFCEECGARLEAACPACGAPVPAGRKFCGACGAPLAGAAAPAAAPATERFASPQAYTPPHLAERILRERSALSGERKQVTVLFADVSGFTSLSERLDPEEVHTLINRAFELMLAEIHRYEGTVNQFLGDGLMALFGAPIAHEDHARRAARAALGVQRALAGYRDEVQASRGIDFGVRLGLNTGLVVVGAIGDNLRMDYTAVGDTTNTAARMQQLARPGQVVVADATQRLIAPYFELAALGAIPVKGKSQPVAAWELRGDKGAVSRLAARLTRGLSPFLGRDDALATLDRAFAAARAGAGQVVFVVGEAGIGKSRLVHEFRRRLGEAASWYEGECVAFAQSTPFHAIIDTFRRIFGVTDRDGEAEVVAKIETAVAGLGDDGRDVAPWLRYLLRVDPGDPAIAGLDPAQRRARIVAAIQRFTAAASRQRPIVLVIEDLHWSDSASEDYLKAFAETLPGMAVLLVVTYRPAYAQPFGERTDYWRIVLRPVEDAAALGILQAALAVEDLPRELAEPIARKAEGNPFFLEEIGRTLTETGAVRVENGRLVATAAAATIAVPDTVQDVIAARLDRLAEPQKRTVQTASVIGREFALGLLRRVTDLHDTLEQSLGELKRIELIYERVGLGDLEYVFRHALTQDVAYASLLQSERRRLHALIGAAIEEVHAGRLDERAEELASHYARGEVWERVVRWARVAAERAEALCVDARAVEFYEQALEALRHLPETADTARAGIDVRLAMRASLWRGGQPDRLFALFKEAEALAAAVGDTDRLDAVYAFFAQYHWARGEQALAVEYGHRCLERASARDDLGLRVTGLYYLGHAHHALGQWAEAVRVTHELLGLLEGPWRLQRFGLSGLPIAGACAGAAVCLAELGDDAGALAMLERGRQVADEAGHLYSRMVVAAFHGAVLVRARRGAEAIAVLEPAIPVCREKRFVGQLINALNYLAAAYVLAGRAGDAVAPAEESIALQNLARVSVGQTIQHTTLVSAHTAGGDLERAAAHLETALGFAERQGERGAEGWARLAGAELARARGDRAAAVRHLDEAQEIAEELGMRPLLERCRAALARLG